MVIVIKWDSSKDIEIAFPINSNLLLILRDKDYFYLDSQLHNHFVKLDTENVIFFNALQVQQSYRYVFCKDKNFELANKIIKNEPELMDLDHYRFIMG